MSTKLLVDGDGLLYRCGFAVEKSRYLLTSTDPNGNPIYAPFDSVAEYKEYAKNKKLDEEMYLVWNRRTVEPVQNAYFLVSNVMNKLIDRFKCGFEVYLTPSVGNFREQVATIQKYKGNRDAQARPKHYKEIANYLIEQYGASYSVAQEADDDLGIRATALAGSVIVSLDKDLDQVPGRHYNWVNEEEYEVSKKEGIINFYSQVLSGDATDNISGITGVGPVRARKLLTDCRSSKDCWEVVRSAYSAEFGDAGETRAIENARLCWVRREDGQVWQPPA